MYINERLYQFLIDKKIIEENKLKESLQIANEKEIYLYHYLFNNKLVKEKDLYKLLGEFYSIPYSEIISLSLEDEIVNKPPIYLLKDLSIIPVLRKGSNILIAINDPQNLSNVDILRKYFHDSFEITLITKTNMANLFEYIENKFRKKEVISDGTIKIEDTEEEIEENILADSPAVTLADSLLREAVSSNASDIHIEPFEEIVKVRFRVDGVLLENTRFPRKIYNQLLARFKIIANLNIAERRIPQDGKLQLTINNLDYDFRISTIPTIYGEKIVIRIYNNESSNQAIESLGLYDEQLKVVRRMISKPYGVILVTGPTGSGKTTTLYSFLKELNNEKVNITTVEDPVENNIEGINQVQINPKAGLTFASALRSILRQDPNIIMVGEIRDEETAQMAVRAAITGHLVFSTLHTNDAIGAITRLVDMGIPRYLLVDAVSGSIAQRLARKLCDNCKVKYKPSKAELERLGIPNSNIYLYKPVGCNQCYHTGYRGRRAVFEVLDFDSKLKELIEKPNLGAEDIRKVLVKNNMQFLQDNFRRLVVEGITSIEEYDATINYE